MTQLCEIGRLFYSSFLTAILNETIEGQTLLNELTSKRHITLDTKHFPDYCYVSVKDHKFCRLINTSLHKPAVLLLC